MKKLILIASLIVAGFTILPAHAGVPCSVPFNLTNGTVADATQVMANYNAILSCLSTSAAAAGSNNDITALNALSPPITALCGANGFAAKNNTGTPNTQIDISYVQASVTNVSNQVQSTGPGSVTLNFSTVGAANGLDSGSIATSSIYFIYLIGNGTTIASLASLSSTAPVLPAGYSYSCRVGAWVTGTAGNLLPLAQRGNRTQQTIASLSTLTTAGLFENHTVISGCNADPVTLVATTFGGIPPTAVSAFGSLASGGTNQVAIGTVAGSVAQKFLIGNINNGSSVPFYTIPFDVETTTAQTLFVCNASVQNQINVQGWVDSANVK